MLVFIRQAMAQVGQRFGCLFAPGHKAESFGNSWKASSLVRGETWTYPGPSTNSRRTGKDFSTSLKPCLESNCFHSASEPLNSPGNAGNRFDCADSSLNNLS